LVAERLKYLYTKVNLFSGKRLDILVNTLNSFSKARAAQAAASMAYYAFFSLFPLVLIFIAVGSFFLKTDLIYSKIMALAGDAFPLSKQWIYDTLESVIARRGSMGLLGLIGLVWSASGVFTTLVLNINLAWIQARKRNFIQERFLGLGMIALLSILFILSLGMDATTKVLASMRFPLLANISVYESRLWTLFTNFLPWLFIFSLFLVLYRWAPTVRPAWWAVLWASFVAATGWKMATDIIAWYLVRGLIRYELIYGSLGTVAALLFLIYVIGLIILFGAHLCAAIDQWLKSRSVPNGDNEAY
jgi:YihY family inner membrane protein